MANAAVTSSASALAQAIAPATWGSGTASPNSSLPMRHGSWPSAMNGRRRNRAAHWPQEEIALRVTEGVVHLLQPVEVDEDGGDGPFVDGDAEEVEEPLPIAEPRERVASRLVLGRGRGGDDPDPPFVERVDADVEGCAGTARRFEPAQRDLDGERRRPPDPVEDALVVGSDPEAAGGRVHLRRHGLDEDRVGIRSIEDDPRIERAKEVEVGGGHCVPV